MHRYGMTAIAVAAFIALSASYASGQKYSVQMNGFNVTGGLNGNTGANTGAIFTKGTGTLDIDLDTKTQTATYRLTYSDLTSPVVMAHIHFGQVHVPGGIMVWLCQTTGAFAAPKSVAGITPFCKNRSANITGTITAANIVAIPGQNVTAGNFNELVEALAANTAYGNVHTVKFPTGEIRGECRAHEEQQQR